jgi:predicted AAA+ superfamily ATPase
MIERALTTELLESLGDSPAVFLQGPRQAGKTTLARALAAHQHPARYVTLDDAATLAAAKQDPQAFVGGFRGPVIIDEVQRVPDLAMAIKASVDLDRTPGRFFLTGSASVLMLPRIADYLAGRIEIHTLWPLSQGELNGTPEQFAQELFGADFATHHPGEAIGREDVVERILKGGFPAAIQRASQKRRQAWFGSYVTTILQRDVRDMASIEGLSEMPRLLGLLATRVGALINYADLSRSLSMPQSTLKRYMALLEASLLVQPLPAWSANLGKRLAKSPKIMLADSGLLVYLLGAEKQRLLNDASLLGHIFENFVAMELRKQLGWLQPYARLFHFRASAGQEVDILIESPDGRLVGIEVKASTAVSPNDFRGLQFLRALAGPRFVRGVVLYLGREGLTFDPQMCAWPVSALWQQMG